MKDGKVKVHKNNEISIFLSKFLVATICASAVNAAASNGKYEADNSGKYVHSVAGQYNGADNRGLYR